MNNPEKGVYLGGTESHREIISTLEAKKQEFDDAVASGDKQRVEAASKHLKDLIDEVHLNDPVFPQTELERVLKIESDFLNIISTPEDYSQLN
jgi:hypothetical protein